MPSNRKKNDPKPKLYMAYVRATLRGNSSFIELISSKGFPSFDSLVKREINFNVFNNAKKEKKAVEVQAPNKNFFSAFNFDTSPSDATLIHIQSTFKIPLSFPGFDEEIANGNKEIIELVERELERLNDPDLDYLKVALKDLIKAEKPYERLTTTGVKAQPGDKKEAPILQEPHPSDFKEFLFGNSSLLDEQAETIKGNWQGTGEDLFLDYFGASSKPRYRYEAKFYINIVEDRIVVNGLITSFDHKTKKVKQENITFKAVGFLVNKNATLTYAVKSDSLFTTGAVSVRFNGMGYSDWYFIVFRAGMEGRSFAKFDFNKI